VHNSCTTLTFRDGGQPSSHLGGAWTPEALRSQKAWPQVARRKGGAGEDPKRRSWTIRLDASCDSRTRLAQQEGKAVDRVIEGRAEGRRAPEGTDSFIARGKRPGSVGERRRTRDLLSGGPRQAKLCGGGLWDGPAMALVRPHGDGTNRQRRSFQEREVGGGIGSTHPADLQRSMPKGSPEGAFAEGCADSRRGPNHSRGDSKTQAGRRSPGVGRGGPARAPR